MTLRFGTDGVRGPAPELSDRLVTALGRAAATVLGGERFVVGRDPRESGPRIERALVAGLSDAAMAVETVGTVPTPVVAWICADRGVAGAMISASHNAYGDNGIKFFAPGGLKLSDAVEAELEAELDRVLGDGDGVEPPASPGTGRAHGVRRRRGALRPGGAGLGRGAPPRRAARGARLRQRSGVDGGAFGGA